MLIKIANSDFILDTDHQLAPEKALSSPEITARFQKIASEIKKVAPKSTDFLYFIARGIHAMEHAAIDPVTRQYNPQLGHIAIDNGHGVCATCNTPLLKTASGHSISGLWCSASEVEPWINQNGDAFPESELLAEVADPMDPTRTIRAYQTFVGKGLFTDHKSSEVENIRGIILDAEYDYDSKGVDLLIALDKINYPELARQVSAGYSAQVSMGTQVNYSLCNICGNKAVTEHDYCTHVRDGKAIVRAGQPRCYEINNGLNFIEISMVGNAADPRARIRTIVASAQKIKKSIEANLDSDTAETENRLILESINRLEQQIGDLQTHIDSSTDEFELNKQSSTQEIVSKIASLEKQIKEIGGRFMAQKTQNKKAYMQGTVEPDVGNTFEMSDKNYTQYWEEDKHLTGQGMDEGPEGLHSGYGLGSDEEVKKMYYRASVADRRKARKALLEKAAYMQGTVEPEVGTTFEMADKNYKQYWEEDKHLHGQGMDEGPEGWHSGYGLGSDEQVKKELLRAKLRAKLEKSANPAKNKWTIFAGNQPVLSVSAEQAYGSDLDAVATDVDDEITHQEWFDSKNYGINLIQAVKHLGIEKVASQIERAKTITAQAAPMPAAPDAGAPMPAGNEMPPMDEGMPEEGLEGEEAPEMEASEGIKAAAERIESAKDEILSLVDGMEGEEALEGEALADEMGAAGEELGELGGEMGAAEELPPAAANAYKKLTRHALRNADHVLKKAERFVIKFAEDKPESEGGMPDWLQEKREKASGEKKDEDEKKDSKKEAAHLARLLLKKLAEDKDEDEDDADVEIEVKDADKEDVEVKESFTKEELKLRKAARRAFAQQIYNLTEGDMIAEAHPEGGNETTFPGQEHGKIETETEAQEDDTEVANSVPRGELVARRKYRARLIEAAVKIAESDAAEIAQKATDAEDAEEMADQKKKELADATSQENDTTTASTKTAEADNEAKQYYKELASQSATGQGSDPEVSKFYTELTQDFHGKKSTAAVHDYGLKMKRAFAVSYRKAYLGQIESTQEAIEADVDRMMKLDDESFTALADVIDNTKKGPNTTVAKSTKKQIRTAGAMNVGIDQQPASFQDQLNGLPWK